MSQHDSAPAPAERPEQEALIAQLESRVTEQEALIAQLESRVTELEDRRLRALAELDNVRKRAAKEAERERARVLREWLPVLDNLDLALRHADSDPGTLVEGVKVVGEQAVAVLDRLGFPRQDDAEASFDPSRHEAVGVFVTQEVPPGTVVSVLKPGYGEGERQLRPAAVIVSKAD